MKVLVIGRGRGVWDEVAEAKSLCTFDAVIAINSAGCDYPEPLDHWATFHTPKIDGWVAKRRANGYPDAGTYWCSTYHYKRIVPKVPMRKVRCHGGSSGMIAIDVADALGATHIVLAGVPMTVEAGHYDTTVPWAEAELHRKWWVRMPMDLAARVRSMSGWTRDMHGAPTKEWLDGDCAQRHPDPVPGMVEAPPLGQACVLEEGTQNRSEDRS